ncbi:MAG: efflux RND transporter periplasmic adaptor subunit [Burkholderiaceae bacterium]|nr:efflux RND transporter periplasmic adaptor subunit [Burkholderiaceae bacterium]
MIEPSQKLAIRSTVTASIAAMHVDRGSVIKKGQTLVTLDSSVESATLASAKFRSVMQGQVAAAEARVVHGKDKLGRREELRQQSYVSAQDRDDAAAELRAAEADLLEAKDNRQLAALDVQRLAAEMGRRVIASPINGVVTERLLNPGELAQAGESAGAILKLAQTDPARVEVVLPAAKHGRVKVGDAVTIKPEAPFTGTYKAVVKVVDSVIDSASGTFGVRLEFANPSGAVPLGIRCSAEL